jgi:hypothetical protein
LHQIKTDEDTEAKARADSLALVSLVDGVMPPINEVEESGKSSNKWADGILRDTHCISWRKGNYFKFDIKDYINIINFQDAVIYFLKRIGHTRQERDRVPASEERSRSRQLFARNVFVGRTYVFSNAPDMEINGKHLFVSRGDCNTLCVY